MAITAGPSAPLGPDTGDVDPSTGLSAADERRRVALRRMKALATSLFVAAAVIYGLTLNQEGALGFVNSAAEAGMVGALADWFAVTALFRRPLGLPIPHTALIPTRKDQLGESLEEFVATNFLSEPIVRDKIARAEPTRRLGGWLADPEHATRVTHELAAAGRGVLTVLRDDDVATILEQVLLPRLAAVPVGPAMGKVLDEVLDDGAHRNLLDLLLDQGLSWLDTNRESVMALVTDQAPTWTPQWVDNRIARRVYDEIYRWVNEVRMEPDHQARRALDDMLRRLAHDLQNDERTQERVEAIKQRLLEHPDMRQASLAIWSTVRRVLLEAIEDEDGELRHRVTDALVQLGHQLNEDAALQKRIDTYVGDVAGYVVRNYATEVATVISDTVKRWDADDASRRIELHVGRDLQFIRINGTVVGALAGLAIHTISVLVS